MQEQPVGRRAASAAQVRRILDHDLIRLNQIMV
jgi:hypothetical protein